MAFAPLPSKVAMYKFHINLLLVGSSNQCAVLKTALLSSDLIKQKPYKLIVHQTETCSNIPAHENLHVDFVVFVVDCRVSHAIKKVHDDVMNLPPELGFHRFCVLNAAYSDTKFTDYANTTEKLIRTFKVNHNAQIINERFDDPRYFSDVASRVIRLVSRILDFPIN